MNSGATVVDVQRAFVERSPDGIIGSQLMLEHLHPNLEGYFVMADVFYNALAEGAEAFVHRSAAKREVLYTVVDSLFGEYRLQQLMGSWPFQAPGVTLSVADTITARSHAEVLALRLFRGDASWFETMIALYELYVREQNDHSALRVALAMVQQFPYIATPYMAAARTMVSQRRLNDAVPYLEVALGIEELADAHYLLGNVHLAHQRLEPALRHLLRAVELDSSDEVTLFQLAQAYVLARREVDALSVLGRLLELSPDHHNAITLRRYLLESASAE